MAKRRGFTHRSWSALLAAAREVGVDDGTTVALRTFVRARTADVKRSDAESLLRMLASGATRADVARAGRNPATTRRPTADHMYVREWQREHPVTTGDVSVTSADVLAAAALLAPDFPTWRHQRAIRLLALAELTAQEKVDADATAAQRWWEVAAGDRAEPLRVAALRRAAPEVWAHWLRREYAVAQLLAEPDGSAPWRTAWTADPAAEATLEVLAVAHLRRSGVLADNGIPESVLAAWLDDAERAMPEQSRWSRLASRTLGTAPMSEVNDVFVVDLVVEGVVDSLAPTVANAWQALREQLRSSTSDSDDTGDLDDLDVQSATADAVREDGAMLEAWRRAWDASDLDVELRRRGLGTTLPALAAALRWTA
jgi:hypothetical protein